MEFFYEFAQKIREIENPKKGMYSFMLDFLGDCFPMGYILKFSDSSAQRYFKGEKKKDGRVVDSIGHFLTPHMGCFDINRLTAYIKDITKYHTDKKQIVDMFKYDISDLTEENYPEKLSKLCKSLLEKAVENAGKEEQSTDETEINRIEEQRETSDSEQDTDFLLNIPCGIAKNINETIITVLTHLKTLEQQGVEIAEWVLLHSEFMLDTKCELWVDFKREHQEFQKQTVKLHVYFEKYDCCLFGDAFPYRYGIALDSFWRCHLMSRDAWILDRQLHSSDYIEILKNISNELDKVLESS